MIELDTSIIGAANELEVVRRHEHRGAGRVDLAKELEDAARRALVEVARWLVGDENEWVVYQRARECDALLFAARQLAGQGGGLRREPDLRQRARDLAGDVRLRRSDDLERERDVRLGRAVLEQLEVLEDDSEPPAQLRPPLAA